MRIVRATGDDWERVRELRLRALEDAPSAFASRLEDERDHPEASWRRRIDGGRTEPAATFLAVERDGVVGLVGAFLTAEDPSRAHLVSMWVAPGSRRRGAGRGLVDAVADWARSRGASTLELWVTETNEAARRLYASCGFVQGRERQPLRSDPRLFEVLMRLPIGPDA